MHPRPKLSPLPICCRSLTHLKWLAWMGPGNSSHAPPKGEREGGVRGTAGGDEGQAVDIKRGHFVGVILAGPGHPAGQGVDGVRGMRCEHSQHNMEAEHYGQPLGAYCQGLSTTQNSQSLVAVAPAGPLLLVPATHGWSCLVLNSPQLTSGR